MAEPSEQLALDWSDGLFEVADEKRRTVAAGRSSVEVPAAEPISTERSAVPDPVLVATDGSCLRNPGGPTGWAWVRADGAWASGGRPEGTNQIGELMAVVLALTDHPDVRAGDPVRLVLRDRLRHHLEEGLATQQLRQQPEEGRLQPGDHPAAAPTDRCQADAAHLHEGEGARPDEPLAAEHRRRRGVR